MRRLVNNWLYGQTSKQLAGRLDSEIYGNSCEELLNMYVHRQGGISRRYPLKKLTEVSGYTRLIPFTVDKTNSFIILLGAGAIGYYDFNTGDLDNTLTLPTSWSTISAEQCKQVKYANYYNDLYLVHESFPLIRVSFTGVHMIVTEPKVYVNQDVKPHAVQLTDIVWGTATSETVYLVLDGKQYSVSITSGTTLVSFFDSLAALPFDGWDATLTQSGNPVIVFTPTNKVDGYRYFDVSNDSTTFTFKKSSGTISSFTFDNSFSLLDVEVGSNVVYGSDDFPDMKLNTAGYYASDIAIIAEKMWLSVNGNPCRVYVSRPYGTSQLVYPKDSNDTILDFIQFEVVTSEKTEMKEEDDLPVVIGFDANNEKMWSGSISNQRLWQPPASGVITDYKSLKEYTAENEYEVEQDAQDVVTKLTLGDRVINYTNVYYLTYDTEYDASKDVGATYNPTTKVTTSDVYYIDTNGSKASTSNGGLRYEYYLTSDINIDKNTQYYSDDQGTEVYPTSGSPKKLGYYERRVLFAVSATIYEYGKQYVMSSIQLRVSYLDNGMIYQLKNGNSVVAEARPYYQFDLSTDSSAIYTETVEVDKVATASTGMEMQLSSGRNDKIAWIGISDFILIGTESSEWKLSSDINALDGSASMYSSFGSVNGLKTNVGTDLIFLQRGNGLRLMYRDYYGLQNVELTLTNPEIMDGSIAEIAGMIVPEPSLYSLKSDGSIVAMCVDRQNGVQAFSEWTFANGQPISMAVVENDTTQVLVVLMKQVVGLTNKYYLAYFDNTERDEFLDCGLEYRKTDDTSALQGKTYYSKTNGEYFEATVQSGQNPKTLGLYEFGLYDKLNEYVSRMTANPFDTVLQDGSVTIGVQKNVSKIIFRCLDTGHLRTYHDERQKTETRNAICEKDTYNHYRGLGEFSQNTMGGTTNELEITVEAVGSEPMTLLAMAYELRVNRNG